MRDSYFISVAWRVYLHEQGPGCRKFPVATFRGGEERPQRRTVSEGLERLLRQSLHVGVFDTIQWAKE